MSLVLSYLRYLRDVSRKLILKNGYEKILPGSAANPDCFWPSNIAWRTWLQKVRDTTKRGDRRLFLGLGLITGTITTQSNSKKKIAGPLILIEAEVDYENNSIFLNTSSKTLNYDLITFLMGLTSDEGEDIGPSYMNQDDSTRSLLLLMDELEENLEKLEFKKKYSLNDNSLETTSSTVSYIKALAYRIKEVNPSISISQADDEFTYQNIKNAIDRRTPVLFLESFLFCAKYPDQLTTYTALQVLIKQFEKGNVKNPLLEKLISGTLGSYKGEDSESQSIISEEEVRGAIKYLPITLSDNQKKAIRNAWMCETSYIQGPPGTGKSHTIASIMMTALLMKKKVLLISQKKAAINVVRDKIAELSGDKNAVVFITTDSDIKENLRQHLANSIQLAGNDHNHRIAVKALQKENAQKTEVDETRQKLYDTRQSIKRMVEVQRQYYVENKKFISKRDNFIKTFGENHAEFFEVSTDNEVRFKKCIAQLKLIYESQTRTRKDVLFVKSVFKNAIRFLNAQKSQYTPLDPSLVLYISDLLDCSKSYTLAQRHHQRATDANNINQFRKSYQNELGLLIDQQRKLLSTTINSRWRYSLKSNGNKDNVSAFRSMLYNTRADLIEEKMSGLDYKSLTDAFPLWAGLIRDLGSYLRFDSQLFDLLIIDESSQVNIAETIPAIFRSKRVCVVGDREQLGLESAGLQFINEHFEKMAWNRNFESNTHSYDFAQQKGLIVSKHSILEFITNPNNNLNVQWAMLDEHFRSMPKLAQFTSNKFYQAQGGLKIMTLKGENISKPCFSSIKTNGPRESDAKIVQSEVGELLRIFREIAIDGGWKSDPLLKHHFGEGTVPSIGILSFTRNQNDLIKAEFENIPLEIRKKHKVFIGTTEEFQGNERNIMFILPAIGSDTQPRGNFYNERHRFNVATSRAINFTYLIYGGLTPGFTLFDSYLKHFEINQNANPLQFINQYYQWRFDEARLESEFEKRVYLFLVNFFAQEFPHNQLAIFNQAESCGKRLDFVVYNPLTSKAFAIEVDGFHHYEENSINYTEDHLERESLLTRAGWKILHIPYYRWYSNGWLADVNQDLFEKFTASLKMELKKNTRAILSD